MSPPPPYIYFKYHPYPFTTFLIPDTRIGEKICPAQFLNAPQGAPYSSPTPLVTNGFYDGVSNLLAKPRSEKNTTGGRPSLGAQGNYLGPRPSPVPLLGQPERFP